METNLNSKLIIFLLLSQLLFSCKSNISAGVGSDGKSLDSTATSSDTITATKIQKD
jgi:predicted small secreted protein